MPRPSLVSTRSRTTVYLFLLLTLAFSLTGTLLTATALGVRAEGSIRTVCLSGPPTCDYTSIQAAIDASAAGDEIIVENGVYTEALTLRDQITIRGAEAATTTLTALAGSIIQASDVASVTLSHLVLDGRGVLTSGMSLTNVNIALDHIVIRDLTGKRWQQS